MAGSLGLRRAEQAPCLMCPTTHSGARLRISKNPKSVLGFGLGLVLIFSLSGCSSLLRRSEESGFADRDRYSSYGLEQREVRASESSQSAQDLGFDDTQSLNPQQRYALKKRLELREAERALAGRREREQYYRYKAFLRSDQERVDLLNLPTFEARQRWLDSRGYSSENFGKTAQTQALIEANDITVGMSKDAVKESWGEPEVVEVAGSPIYGNERWKYQEYVSSPEGYLSETRLVYFEGGRVVGWEKQ